MLFVGGAAVLFVCCCDASEENEVIDKPTGRTPPGPPTVGDTAEQPKPNGFSELERF
jgi:hypothetical protein